MSKMQQTVEKDEFLIESHPHNTTDPFILDDDEINEYSLKSHAIN
tara:strand:- start:1559 stop:1693 length:135 start_codon:yes stop_codon:yes gene_type:complete